MALFLALMLLIPALAGFFRLRPHQLPANLLGFYWFPSWIGQSFAGPDMVLALVLAAFSDGAARIVALTAAALFLAVHLRNRRDGAALMRAVGLDVRLPLLAGLWPFSSGAGIERISALPYAGDGDRTTLDIVRARTQSAQPMPVLIHIPGGAWVMGRRNQQAKPLLNHLARHGWLCLDINYRLGPTSRFPAMLTDVQRAIAWAAAHAAEYGGDPARIALTGGSAGGHLAALGALVPGEAAGSQFAAKAAVPLYGRYDFLDRNNLLRGNHDAVRKFAAEKIMPADADETLWDLASPLAQVRGDAPPMLVIHGRHDSLLPVEEAALFVAALRSAGCAADYVELWGGQHAYDLLSSATTAGHVRAVRHWLEQKV